MTPTVVFRVPDIKFSSARLLGLNGCCGSGRQIVLNLGPAAQLAHDSLHDFALLLGLEELDDLILCLGESGSSGGLLLCHLDDMVAELGLYGCCAHAANLLRKGCISELGNHPVLGKESQVTAALLGAGLLGKLRGKLREVLALVGTNDGGLGFVFGILELGRRRTLGGADEDVAGLHEIGVGELLLVGVVELLGIILGGGVLALHLGLHPLGLAHGTREVGGELVKRQARLLHLTLEEVLGGKLLLDLVELGGKLLLADLDLGGLFVDEFLHDHAVEDLVIPLQLLVSRQLARVGTACSQGILEILLKLRFGNLLAVNRGDWILQCHRSRARAPFRGCALDHLVDVGRCGCLGSLGGGILCLNDADGKGQGEKGEELFAHGCLVKPFTLHGKRGRASVNSRKCQPVSNLGYLLFESHP